MTSGSVGSFPIHPPNQDGHGLRAVGRGCPARANVSSEPRSSAVASAPGSGGSGPAFELLESKLRPPRVLSGAIARATLIERLEASPEVPVVVLSAGPGWGKTTLLAQWASASQRPFAWLSVDDRDNDPIVLLTYIAAALDRVSPLDPSVFDALASPGVSVE